MRKFPQVATVEPEWRDHWWGALLGFQFLQIAAALSRKIVESLELVGVLRLHIGEGFLESVDRLV
jgi:hypothetical protein